MASQPTNQPEWIVVGPNGKPVQPHRPPTVTPPNPAPTNAPSATNRSKIRVILTKKRNQREFNASIELSKLIIKMFELDTALTGITSHNNELLTFSSIAQFPPDEPQFLDFFAPEQYVKRNGDISITMFFFLDTHTPTQYPLLNMKQNNVFFHYVRDNGIFLFDHPFNSATVSRPGFFFGILPKAINIEDFNNEIKGQLTALIGTNNIHFIPTFAINPGIIRHRDHTGYMHSTESLQVECDPSDAVALTTVFLLLKINKLQYGTFMPFSVQQQNSDLLTQTIADNNHFQRHQATTIYITGLHPDTMNTKLEDSFTVQAAFMSQDEVFSIQRTVDSTSLGKWTVITSLEHRDATMKTLRDITVPITELPSHIAHLSDNNTYAAGITILTYPTSPRNHISASLDIIHREPTFLSPQENSRYTRHYTQARAPRATNYVQRANNNQHISYSHSPLAPTTTNAWPGTSATQATLFGRQLDGPTTALSTTPRTNSEQRIVFPPLVGINGSPNASQPRSVGTRSINSRSIYTENTAVSLLQRQIEAVTNRVDDMAAQQQTPSPEMLEIKQQIAEMGSVLQTILLQLQINTQQPQLQTLVPCNISIPVVPTIAQDPTIGSLTANQTLPTSDNTTMDIITPPPAINIQSLVDIPRPMASHAASSILGSAQSSVHQFASYLRQSISHRHTLSIYHIHPVT